MILISLLFIVSAFIKIIVCVFIFFMRELSMMNGQLSWDKPVIYLCAGLRICNMV